LIIFFRTASPEDEKLILPQFRPYVEQGEIANLPSFHFYMKLGAINPQEPFTGETIIMSNEKDQKTLRKVISISRKLYAKKYVKEIHAGSMKNILKVRDRISPESILP